MQINTYSKIFLDAIISRNMIISLHSLTILMSFYVKKPCGKLVKALNLEEVKKLHRSIFKNMIFNVCSNLYSKQFVKKLLFCNDFLCFSKWKHNLLGHIYQCFSTGVSPSKSKRIVGSTNIKWHKMYTKFTKINRYYSYFFIFFLCVKKYEKC